MTIQPQPAWPLRTYEPTPTPPLTLEIEPSGPSPDLPTSGHGVLVGISTDGYTIANHQQWHLLVNDGWWVFYKDESRHIQAAYLRDDDSVSHRQIVSHQPIARGFSVVNRHDTVYLVYTDPNDQYLYLPSGTIVDNAIDLSDPVTVVQGTARLPSNTQASPSINGDSRGSSTAPTRLAKSYSQSGSRPRPEPHYPLGTSKSGYQQGSKIHIQVLQQAPLSLFSPTNSL